MKRASSFFLLIGYYDLAPPYFEGIHELKQLPISKERYEKNIGLTYYETGHTPYLPIPSLEKLKKDAKVFIEQK